MRSKTTIIHSENVAARRFWNSHPILVKELGQFDGDIDKINPDYIRSFEFENKLMPSTWIVIRIDGCHFHRWLLWLLVCIFVTCPQWGLLKWRSGIHFARFSSWLVSLYINSPPVLCGFNIWREGEPLVQKWKIWNIYWNLLNWSLTVFLFF